MKKLIISSRHRQLRKRLCEQRTAMYRVALSWCNEPALADDPPGTRYQFERHGYFMSDPEDSGPERLVFNRTVTLRDSWAKIEKKLNAPG